MNAASAPALTLDRLGPGERATILALGGGEDLQRRLRALGLRVGEAVSLLRHAPLGGPLHLRVGTTELMLRAVTAQSILIAVLPAS